MGQGVGGAVNGVAGGVGGAVGQIGGAIGGKKQDAANPLGL